ncbi:hypothetical protein NC651_035852 [Populus alba x Populus x berolinensis]|nr:hypothetical protein NC651_035852 [Populus alba x Populus x berolinensis]
MQSWCCQHTSVSRGYRYMRNTQRDNQEAVGNTLSRFFRLKIIRIALQMNPTAPYHDPRTNLRYANTDVFKLVRSLPNEHVQRYLALRNAAVTLK